MFAQVFNGYKRAQLPDKSFKPEVYTFGEGGCWTESVTDAENKEMTFLSVAKAVAPPLARVNFRPARTAAEAELLIMVFWGATEGTRGHNDSSAAIDRAGSAASALAMANDAARASNTFETKAVVAAAESAYDDVITAALMNNALRDKVEYKSARIIGYTEVFDRAKFVPQMSFAQDIMSDVANSRYYVVLQAYDFETAAKEKKLKPLWMARISLNANRNNFGRALDHMLANATRYFGQDSDGLRREVERETRVEIGPLKTLGTVPEK